MELKKVSEVTLSKGGPKFLYTLTAVFLVAEYGWLLLRLSAYSWQSLTGGECWRYRGGARLESTALRFLHLVWAAGEAGC